MIRLLGEMKHYNSSVVKCLKKKSEGEGPIARQVDQESNLTRLLSFYYLEHHRESKSALQNIYKVSRAAMLP